VLRLAEEATILPHSPFSVATIRDSVGRTKAAFKHEVTYTRSSDVRLGLATRVSCICFL
jgi:hypothetical protein